MTTTHNGMVGTKTYPDIAKFAGTLTEDMAALRNSNIETIRHIVS
jgi:hypothetical protein